MLRTNHIENSLLNISEVRSCELKTGWGNDPIELEYSIKPKIIGIRAIFNKKQYYLEQLVYDNNAPLLEDCIPFFKPNMKLQIGTCIRDNNKVYKSKIKHRTSSKIPLTNKDYYTEIEYYQA